MPTRARRICPDCRTPVPTGQTCPTCAERRPSRGTPAQRGYDAAWRARRHDYLQRHKWCKLCGKRAKVPDHYPLSRRQLVELGVPDPDADEHLRPLCESCHNRETARNQPGGWNRQQT